MKKQQKAVKNRRIKDMGGEKMICTVTFNPSLDYIVSVEDFKLGLTNRTSSELMLPGGKGINVSTVLMNLGIENTALGFMAGFVGDEIVRKLEEMGVRSDFIRIPEGVSRINLKLKSIDGTEINGMGPEISAEKVQELMKKLDTLKEGDVLFLAGSIPSSMPDDMYEKIMAKMCIRDSYDAKIFENDPFAKLDQVGVGKLMKMAIELGKPVNPNLHVGICGEHGGDPSSVEFCHKIGLNYVSCSPFRVPIARLAAAQAAIAEKNA